MMPRYFQAFAISMALAVTPAIAFDLQGHRGARGLLPENTLPAFEKALSIGVSTLELDVGVSADGVVVVSHDPVLNPNLVRDAGGEWIESGEMLKALTFEQIQTFDVGRLKPGSRGASRFESQKAVDGTRMPSLEQVFDLVKASGQNDVRFNIETKINPLKPDATLEATKFAEVLVATVAANEMVGRVSIQSFDWRTLQHVQKIAPQIETVYLTAQQRWLDNVKPDGGQPSAWTAGFNLDQYSGDVPQMVHAAGGEVWSPFFGDLTAELVKEAQALGLKVIPWTVNDEQMMKDLIDAGVDGIITDYPDRLKTILDAK